MTTKISNNQIAYDFSSFRNAIINGDMRIWQRGTSWADPSGKTYLNDRWFTWDTTSAVVTYGQDTDVPTGQNFPYSLKATVTTGATPTTTQNATLRQRIEGYNFRRFVGKTATLSFWVKSNKTGQFAISFANSDVTRNYYKMVTINSAATWEYKTVTLDFDSDGTWDYANGTGVQVAWSTSIGPDLLDSAGTSEGLWVSTQYLGNSNQTNFSAAASDYFQITGVQLEVGTSASDFEFVDFQTELAQCQRYFETTYNYGTAPTAADFPPLNFTQTGRA